MLDRIKGESGEIALRVGTSETPFGLINVGDAKSLCDHVAQVVKKSGISLTIEDSEFSEAHVCLREGFRITGQSAYRI